MLSDCPQCGSNSALCQDTVDASPRLEEERFVGWESVVDAGSATCAVCFFTVL